MSTTTPQTYDELINYDETLNSLQRTGHASEVEVSDLLADALLFSPRETFELWCVEQSYRDESWAEL